MFDSFGPGTGVMGGFAAGQLVHDLLQGAGNYGDWSRAAVELATNVQASYRHHLEDAEEPQVTALAQDLDALGREAQMLAVVAENRGYGGEEVELLRRLDRLCLRFTNGAPNTDKNPEDLLHDELPDLVAEVFETLDVDAPNS